MLLNKQHRSVMWDLLNLTLTPVVRIFFLRQLSLPALSPSLLRCWKPTCCSSVCRGSTQSWASTRTISCLPSGPSGWSVSSRRRTAPATRETEGGEKKPGKKERTVGRWNRGDEEPGGVVGGEWDADFRSKWVHLIYYFFFVIKKKSTNPGYGQLSFKQNQWKCLKFESKIKRSCWRFPQVSQKSRIVWAFNKAWIMVEEITSDFSVMASL